MLAADYEFIAIAPDRRLEKDRDITGEVEAMLKVVEAAQKWRAEGYYDQCPELADAVDAYERNSQ